MIPIFLGGLASVGVLLNSAVIVFRCTTPLLFFYFIVMGMIYFEFITATSRRWLSLLFIVPLAIFMVHNYCTITNGYAKNAPINEYNIQVMENAKVTVDRGLSLSDVKLQTMVDDLYANGMPYQNVNKFMIPWLKNYYGLPDYVNFVY